MRRRVPKRAFTLMEVLLVLLVIAVAAAVAAPALSGFSRGRRLPNTALALMTTGKWCRAQAIINGTTYRLNIDRPGQQWSVTRDDGTGFFEEVKEEIAKPHPLPEGIAFGNMTFDATEEADVGGDYVTFKPNGRTDVVTIFLLTSERGQSIGVGTDMPLGTFHIMNTPE